MSAFHRYDRPLSCIVMAIDPGKVSGVAYLLRDEIIDHRVVKTASERAKAIQFALTLEEDTGLPLIVVGESWKGRARWQGRNTQTLAGIGAAWGRWAEALELLGVPKRRTLRIDTGTWRRAVFGGPAKRRSEMWKRMAVSWVEAHYGVVVSDDEAEAICIGWLAQRRPQTAAVLPKSSPVREFADGGPR